MNEVSVKPQNEKEVYIAPDIQVIEVNVEKGFAASGGIGEEDEGGF